MKHLNFKQNQIHYYPRSFQVTLNEIAKNADINLHAQYQINNGIVVSKNVYDAIPLSYSNFNIFHAASCVLDAVTHTKTKLPSLELNYDYFDINQSQRSRYPIFYEFLFKRIGHYLLDKTGVFVKTFASKGDTNNAYAFRLMTRYGLNKPNIQCYVDLHQGNFQQNIPYDMFVYQHLLAMFLNHVGIELEGLYVSYDTLICERNVPILYKNKRGAHYVNHPFWMANQPYITKPHFPSSWDLIGLRNWNNQLEIDEDEFKERIKDIESPYYKTLLCLVRAGSYAASNKDITIKCFNTMEEMTTRRFTRWKLLECGYAAKDLEFGAKRGNRNTY